MQVKLKDITKKFGSFTAVDDLSFTIGTGEFFGLLGPNGAGKTTTISMLSTVIGAYMWVTPVPASVLAPLKLVVRKCSYAKNLNRDIIVFRKSSENDPLIQECIKTITWFANRIDEDIKKE